MKNSAVQWQHLTDYGTFLRWRCLLRTPNRYPHMHAGIEEMVPAQPATGDFPSHVAFI